MDTPINNSHIINSEPKMEFIHKNFCDVPENDIIIADFSCSLQRDALIQGRIYLSYYGYYFHSKILGFISTASNNWINVIELRKDKAAYVLPIVINIITKDDKHSFSFLQNRDKVYEIINVCWNNSQTQFSLNKLIIIEKCNSILKSGDIKYSDKTSSSTDLTFCSPDEIKDTIKNDLIYEQSVTDDQLSDIQTSFETNSNEVISNESEEIICNCSNDGYSEIISKSFNANFEDLRKLMFNGNSPVLLKLAQILNLRDFKVSIKSSDDKNSDEGRTITYLYPMGFPFSSVPTESELRFFPDTEWTQDHCYAVSTSFPVNSTYSDHFNVLTKYCFTRISQISTVKIYLKIVFLKKVSSMVRSIITQRSITKTTEYVKTLLQLIEEYLSEVDHLTPLTDVSDANKIPIFPLNERTASEIIEVIHSSSYFEIYFNRIISTILIPQYKTIFKIILTILFIYSQFKIIKLLEQILKYQLSELDLVSQFIDKINANTQCSIK